MTTSGSSLRDRVPEPAVAAAEYAVLLVLAGVFLWRGLIPAWKTLNTDFVDYYLAAQLNRQGYPLAEIYDWGWVQRQKDHAGIDRPIVAFTSLTPFSMLPALPFSPLSPLAAKRGWLLTSLALLGSTGVLLHRLSKLGWRRIAVLTLLAVVPLRNSFLFGQQTILLLFIFTLAAHLYIERRPLASGLVLALGGALKIWPALFLIYFVRKKQWRAALGLVSGSVALWLLSLYLFGLETVRTYLVEVLPWSLRGEGQDPYNINWNSFSAVLHRLFIAEPELNPHPVAHLPALYSILHPVYQGLIFVPFLWLLGSTRDEDDREKLHWGAFLAMLLMVSTQAASYDFVVLVLTAVLAVGYLAPHVLLRQAASVVVFYVLVCAPLYRWTPVAAAGWHTLLAVPRLWAMTGLWICLLAVSRRASAREHRLSLKSPEAAAFISIWFGLVIPAIGLNLLHLRHEFDNYATRLLVAPQAYLKTDPAVARSGSDVLFTMMLNEGYRTGLLREGSLRTIASRADSFHPTTFSNFAWVEEADRTSRVVRFSLDGGETAPPAAVVDAFSAEKPSVSPDGRWLAFIREQKGQGSLWVKQLHQETGSTDQSVERKVSPAGLDVLEATFQPGNGLIFSARPPNGSPALFAAKADADFTTAETGSSPRRYPAASPDGNWLAFSQREGGNWQLWLRDLNTRAERRLTSSDCNSTAPVWYPDSKHLVYATDCGRSLGLTALCRIHAVP